MLRMIVLIVFLPLLLILPLFQEASLASGDPWREMGIIRRVERSLAQDFILPTPDGNKISFSGLRGKVVLLNFWASWCVPCRTEMPSMERLYKIYKDKRFTILAVDFMENTKQVKSFMEEMKLTFPAVMDRDGKVLTLYRVNAIPTSYLIDKAGMVAGIAFGAREWDDDFAFELIEELIRE